MNATHNATMRPEAGKPSGYHAGDAIIRRMMINLATNNANPDAIEAAKDAKDVARAADTKAPAATTEGEEPEPPSLLATVRDAVASGLVSRYSAQWDESQHPRDDDGKFVASLAADVQAGRISRSKIDKIHGRDVGDAVRGHLAGFPGMTPAQARQAREAKEAAARDVIKAKWDADAAEYRRLYGHVDWEAEIKSRNKWIDDEVLGWTDWHDMASQFINDGMTKDEILDSLVEFATRDQETHEEEQQKKADDERKAASDREDEEARHDPEVIWDDIDTRAATAKHRLSPESQRYMPLTRQDEHWYRADMQLPETHAALLAAGWSPEYLSHGGSIYYTNGDKRLRVADHEVPETDERRHAANHGGFSWATSGNQIILPVDDIQAEIRRLTQADENEEDDESDHYSRSRTASCRSTAAARDRHNSSASKTGSSIHWMRVTTCPNGAASSIPSSRASSSGTSSPKNRGGIVCATNTRACPMSAVSSISHSGNGVAITGKTPEFVDRYGIASRVARGLASVMRYRHTDDAPGQRDLFIGEQRRSDKHQGKLRWITLKSPSGAGTTHVQIDDEGTIKVGPKSLVAQNVSHITSVPKAPGWFSGGKKTSSSSPDVEFQEEPQSGKPTASLRRGQHGGPVGATTIDVSKLKVDPKRFQYKVSGIDPTTGTNAELKKIKQYNPMLGGQLLVWQDPADKQTYVINGHHRYELASRSPRGDGTPFDGQMSVYYIDAKDAQEARAHGALTNIAEGRGTSVDAAKFLRDTGGTAEDFAKHGVSLTGAIASSALHLAHLSPSLFQKLTNGAMTEGRALAIAKHLPNQDGQDQLHKYIERRESEKGTSKTFTDGKVAEMARAMAVAKPIQAKSGGMFDDFFDSYPVEQRADIADHIRKNLSSEHRTFATASSERRQGMLEATGTNQLDVEGNKQRAHSAASDLEEFDHRVNAAGHPLAQALDTYAEQMFNEPKKRAAILNDALRHARQILSGPGDSGSGEVNPGRGDSIRRTDGQSATAVNKFSRIAEQVRDAVMRYSSRN